MGNEAEKLFRKESLEKVESPENMNALVRVVNPGISVILAAITLVVIGVLIWAFAGTVHSTEEVYFRAQAGGKAKFYLSEAQAEDVARGCEVRIEGSTGKIMRVSQEAGQAENFMDAYTMHLNGLETGSWVHELRTNVTVATGIHKAEIVKESFAPIQWLIGY